MTHVYQAKDSMNSKATTLHKNDDMTEARRIMRNFGFTLLPVLDENDQVLGTISPDDILMCDHFSDSVLDHLDTNFRIYTADTPLVAIVDSLLMEGKFGYIIVRDNEILGVLSRENLLTTLQGILHSIDNGDGWALGNIFNPFLQKTAYLIGQTGI